MARTRKDRPQRLGGEEWKNPRKHDRHEIQRAHGRRIARAEARAAMQRGEEPLRRSRKRYVWQNWMCD